MFKDLRYLKMSNEWNYLSYSVLQRTACGKIALSGDAHREEGLEGHQDVLERVPHIWEQEDEGLVLQVKVKVLGILLGKFSKPCWDFVCKSL